MFVPTLVSSMVRVIVVAAVAAATAGAQTSRIVWRGLIGETAIELRADGSDVLVGAASDAASVSVTLRASDVRRFADSVTRKLARTRDTTWSVRLDEPGVSAGTLSVSPERRGEDRRWTYRLFVADDPLTTVRQELDAREVRLLVSRLRLAATPPRRPRPRPNAKPPGPG